MLGLLLIYWIGNYFYKLARKYKRNEWGYAIFGVAAYYIGGFALSFLVGIVAEVISPGSVENISDLALELMSIPFGLISCYLFYDYLEQNWHKKKLAETDLTKHLID